MLKKIKLIVINDGEDHYIVLPNLSFFLLNLIILKVMNDQVIAVLTWVVLGLIVGLLARFIMPGRQRGGLIITVLLGIGGALLGGYLGSALGIGTVSGFDIKSLLIATGGAILILLVFRLLRRK